MCSNLCCVLASVFRHVRIQRDLCGALAVLLYHLCWCCALVCQHIGSTEKPPAERSCLRDLVNTWVSLPHWIVLAEASYLCGKMFGIVCFSILIECRLAVARGQEIQCNAGHQSVRSRPIPTHRLECRWFVSTVRDRPLLMGLCIYDSSLHAIADVKRCSVQLIDDAC